jgi:hypothetical protein
MGLIILVGGERLKWQNNGEGLAGSGKVIFNNTSLALCAFDR